MFGLYSSLVDSYVNNTMCCNVFSSFFSGFESAVLKLSRAIVEGQGSDS